MSGERWAVVPNFPLHMVSSEGRVFSWYSEKFLKPGVGSHGYWKLNLGFGKTKLLHVSVAEAFIGPRPDGMEVRHKDGIRTNPRLDNLEYGTPAQNQKDAYRHGTRNKETDLQAGRAARDSKLRRNPDFFKESNRKGTETKDARYGRVWSSKSFAGERYAK